MGRLGELAIQWSGNLDLREYARQANDRLRRIQTVANAEWSLKWEDLVTPASSLRLTGGANDPALNATNGTYDFSVGDYAWAQVELPHAWAEGVDAKGDSVARSLTPHVHWTKITNQSGNVRWELQYKNYAVGSIGDAAFTSIASETPNADTPDTNTAEKHLMTDLGSVDMTGGLISHILVCRIGRIAASGTEYPAAAQLLAFDLHYERDARGSSFVEDKR